MKLTLAADDNSPLTYSVAPSPTNRASVNIKDDDLPNLSIADNFVVEGTGSVIFSPVLDEPAGRDIIITYSTTPTGDFPVEADDYTACD